MNSNGIHKKKVVSVREKRLRGNAAFHVIAKMMRGWVYGDKLHINVGGKKNPIWLHLAFSYHVFKSLLIKSFPRLLFFTVKHDVFFYTL